VALSPVPDLVPSTTTATWATAPPRSRPIHSVGWTAETGSPFGDHVCIGGSALSGPDVGIVERERADLLPRDGLCIQLHEVHQGRRRAVLASSSRRDCRYGLICHVVGQKVEPEAFVRSGAQNEPIRLGSPGPAIQRTIPAPTASPASTNIAVQSRGPRPSRRSAGRRYKPGLGVDAQVILNVTHTGDFLRDVLGAPLLRAACDETRQGDFAVIHLDFNVGRIKMRISGQPLVDVLQDALVRPNIAAWTSSTMVGSRIGVRINSLRQLAIEVLCCAEEPCATVLRSSARARVAAQLR
jgi:hypothetical protein